MYVWQASVRKNSFYAFFFFSSNFYHTIEAKVQPFSLQTKLPCSREKRHHESSQMHPKSLFVSVGINDNP